MTDILPQQQDRQPGIEAEMEPRPQAGMERYRGSGNHPNTGPLQYDARRDTDVCALRSWQRLLLLRPAARRTWQVLAPPEVDGVRAPHPSPSHLPKGTRDGEGRLISGVVACPVGRIFPVSRPFSCALAKEREPG